MILKDSIKERIESFTGDSVDSINSIGGGCISEAYMLKMSSGKNYFLKMNFSVPADMFSKEANGLKELEKAGSLRIPIVILSEDSFILLELIKNGSKKKNFFEDFGCRFAQMHKFTSGSFGFYEDNYIGSNIQKNIPSENGKKNWTSFYFENRILFQYKLAEKNGYATEELRRGISSLENRMEIILKGSEENPSLLHGDLWGGNYMVDENGDACLIDPAVYYGHREADLGMTKLFGGFSGDFYSAYNETFPLPAGYEFRENIYKLYHVLNHLNLFGRGYYSQAISIIKSYTK